MALIIGSAGTSLTEVILLKAIFKNQLVIAFVGVILSMAILVGFTILRIHIYYNTRQIYAHTEILGLSVIPIHHRSKLSPLDCYVYYVYFVKHGCSNRLPQCTMVAKRMIAA
ncbi:hypothetical protein GCM10009411_34190 [Shewanella litoralis]|uniref:Uncharacterized protein n=1 Tax=Shewanella litoralis TaxID=2282700 RepID=A0ABQ2RGZ0_9GAMM|nr:hypothetical protein GCM10009411_34190 [Shewanella litoralis]